MTEHTPKLELKRFIFDNVIVFVRIVVASLTAMSLTIILGRTLGAEGKGIYELSIFLPTLIVNVIFNFGLPISITYHIARHDISFATASVIAKFLSISLSILGIIFGAGIIYFWGTSLFGDVPTGLLYASLALIPLMMLLRNSSAIFRGMQDFRTMGMIDILQPLISLIVLLVMWSLASLNVTLALIALAIGYLAATVYVIFLLMRYMRRAQDQISRFTYADIKNIFSYGFQVYAALVVGNLLLRADILLLNMWGQGTASIGIYSIAVALVERVWTLSSFNNAVLMPRIASWKDDKERQGQLTLLSAKYSFWLGVLIAVALIVFGKPLIVLTVGESFAASFTAILTLLPGVIFYNLIRPIGSSMVGSGKHSHATIYALMALAANVLFNLILIPRYDFIGAGIASSIAYTLYGVLIWFDFVRDYNLPFTAIFVLTKHDRHQLRQLVILVKTKLSG